MFALPCHRFINRAVLPVELTHGVRLVEALDGGDMNVGHVFVCLRQRL